MKYFFILLFCYIIISPRSSAQTSPCAPATSYTTLDINNVRAGLLNGGDLWWDLSDAKYEIPKNGGVHSLFAGAVWIGGIDQGGQLRLAAQTYRQSGNDFWAGPLDQSAETDYNTCNAWDRHWKINKTDIDVQITNFQQYGNNIPLSAIPPSVRTWPGKGNPHAMGRGNTPLNLPATKDYAPFLDNNGDGIYNPEHGDHPDIRGDQAVWWIFNDNGDIHGESGAESIGIEVHVMAYAYLAGNALNNTTFYHYEFYNRGNYNLDSTYIGQWTDVDLGYHLDDQVGYIKEKNMGVVLNGDPLDGPAVVGYGTDPPLLGIKFLNVPQQNSSQYKMSHFIYYHSDFTHMGNPEQPDHFFNFLTGTWKDGSPWLDHNNAPTPYAGVSLPDTIGLLCQETPSDKRFMMSTGPFTFNSGEKMVLDVAVIWSRCDSQYACIADLECLLLDADYIQSVFDNTTPLNTFMPVIEDIVAMASPNPAQDNLRLNLSVPKQADVELIDITGKAVRKYIYNAEELRIYRDDLPSGIYFLKITLEEGDSIVKKIIFN